MFRALTALQDSFKSLPMVSTAFRRHSSFQVVLDAVAINARPKLLTLDSLDVKCLKEENAPLFLLHQSPYLSSKDSVGLPNNSPASVCWGFNLVLNPPKSPK